MFASRLVTARKVGITINKKQSQVRYMDSHALNIIVGIFSGNLALVVSIFTITGCVLYSKYRNKNKKFIAIDENKKITGLEKLDKEELDNLFRQYKNIIAKEEIAPQKPIE